MSKSVYYIDGKFTEDPRIPVDDRGFYFADSVYEVIRAKGEKTYFLKEHLERLQRGLSELKIKLPLSIKQIEDVVAESLKKLDVFEATIYIQITRGKEQRSHLPGEDTKPTFILIASEFSPLAQDILENGVSLILYEDIRWKRCDIKTTMLLPNVLAKMEAKERGFFDALFHKGNIITESTSSSFFAFKDGKLITHPATKEILPSITRAKVIEVVAPELGYKVEERPLFIDELENIDGAFLAGTTYDILPVNRIENIDVPVSSDVLNIQKAYFDIVNKITNS